MSYLPLKCSGISTGNYLYTLCICPLYCLGKLSWGTNVAFSIYIPPFFTSDWIHTIFIFFKKKHICFLRRDREGYKKEKRVIHTKFFISGTELPCLFPPTAADLHKMLILGDEGPCEMM